MRPMMVAIIIVRRRLGGGSCRAAEHRPCHEPADEGAGIVVMMSLRGKRSAERRCRERRGDGHMDESHYPVSPGKMVRDCTISRACSIGRKSLPGLGSNFALRHVEAG
jgi:hypothetical protein